MMHILINCHIKLKKAPCNPPQPHLRLGKQPEPHRNGRILFLYLFLIILCGQPKTLNVDNDTHATLN